MLRRLFAKTPASSTSAEEGHPEDSTLAKALRPLLAQASSAEEILPLLQQTFEGSLLDAEVGGRWLPAVATLIAAGGTDVLEEVETMAAALARDADLDKERGALVLAEKVLADRHEKESDAPSASLAALVAGLRAAANGQRCLESLSVRQEALGALMQSVELRRASALRKAEEAVASAASFKEQLAASPTSGGERDEEALHLEASVNELQEKKRELKLKLEEVSRSHDDAVARQKAHMSQVDGWRLDKEKVSRTAADSHREAQEAREDADRRRTACTEFVTLLTPSQGGDEEMEAAKAQSPQDIGTAAAAVVAATSARLTSARKRAEAAKAEHRAALDRMSLLGVSGADLPTQEAFANSGIELQDACAAFTSLGGILTQRGEVEELLREAREAAKVPGPSAAEAKAAWAQRWAAMGDAAQALAATMADSEPSSHSSPTASRPSAAPSLSAAIPPAETVPRWKAGGGQRLPSLGDESSLI